MATEAVSNTYDLGSLKFWALGDRVLIEEDKFKSGYECVQCGGTGKVACSECGGTTRLGKFKCQHCEGGQVVCPECVGKGGIIITPDIAQRRPTTGRVVSAGPKCEVLDVGQSVLFSNFAGYVIDLNRAGRPVTLRILHESEVLCALEGQLDLRSLRGKSEIAEFGG